MHDVVCTARAAAVLSRLLTADWDGLSSFDHAVSRRTLMREYLRRAAWWARELHAEGEWPFFDIAVRFAPDVRAPEDLTAPLETLIHERIGWPRVASTCRAALRWAALLDAGVPVPEGLPDPFEPLILMFERGGGFMTENGFIELDGSSLPLITAGEGTGLRRKTAQDFLLTKPFSALDQSSLDALDEDGGA